MLQPTLPDELKGFAGRILDADSHEMMPAQQWKKEFGPLVADLADAFLSQDETNLQNGNHPNVPDFAGDVRPIDAESIWLEKGCAAPGAVDPARRLQVMDAMGISQQLLFPTGVGMFGVILATLPQQDNGIGYMPHIGGDRYAIGQSWVDAYNEWGIRAAQVSDRIRPVLPVMALTVDELMKKTRHLIDNGVRGIWLPSAALPGGRSPADYSLDPFWAMLAERKITACLHIGGEGQFLETLEWGNARVFKNYRVMGEFRGDPWWVSINHLPTQNFLATMLMGGVFERHPELVLGVIETSSWWIGPMIENLDVWASKLTRDGTRTENTIRLPQSPSFYLRRNVRATAFDFEPIGTFMDRHPVLQDILCFATDYPHIEGGKNPAGKMHDSIKHLGPEVVEKFFVKNAEKLFQGQGDSAL